MSIILTPETEYKLNQIATRRGTSPDALANQLLTQSLGEFNDFAPNPSRADGPEDQLTPSQLSASVERLRYAFADAETGRLFDADEVFAGARKQVTFA